MSKLTLKLLQITVVIPLILSLTFYYYSAHSYDGTLKTNRFPNKTITIERDEFGIPKITGSTLTECFYGLGFAHAQDRLWNMYLKKMFLNGRLSELFGPDALDMDKSLRTLSLIRTSEINLKYMKNNDLEKLQAYTNGVNDYA
jgi:acyl-homoserine lactone acylase PvdQ